MAGKQAKRQELEVHLGAGGRVVGRLLFSSGKRSAFRYDEQWLQSDRYFAISPDLQPVLTLQHPRGVYFRSLEDTGPDSWGERVIRRAHAKLREKEQDVLPLDPVDYLTWVDDEARVGALRLFDPEQRIYLHTAGAHRHVPPLVELDKVLHAAQALEDGTESTQDLQYLIGRGTSLGGARPKSTVLDTDGWLALGKFPSQADKRDVVRGEVLAMQLAAKAGIRVAHARVAMINETAVAVIRRFDRTADGARIPYMSAATMLLVDGREEEHAYTELVDVLLKERARAPSPTSRSCGAGWSSISSSATRTTTCAIPGCSTTHAARVGAWRRRSISIQCQATAARARLGSLKTPAPSTASGPSWTMPIISGSPSRTPQRIGPRWKRRSAPGAT